VCDTFTRTAPEGTSLDRCLAGSQSMPQASLLVLIQLLSSFKAFILGSPYYLQI